MPKKASWRAVKRHRNYTVDDVFHTLNVSKGTVRRWIKTGLPALKDQKPSLILGGDLIGYLQLKVPAKHKCRLEECYCFSCRAPKRPAFNEVEFHSSNAKTGNLRALCETCSTVMHKRISQANFASLSKSVTVTLV